MESKWVLPKRLSQGQDLTSFLVDAIWDSCGKNAIQPFPSQSGVVRRSMAASPQHTQKVYCYSYSSTPRLAKGSGLYISSWSRGGGYLKCPYPQGSRGSRPETVTPAVEIPVQQFKSPWQCLVTWSHSAYLCGGGSTSYGASQELFPKLFASEVSWTLCFLRKELL